MSNKINNSKVFSLFFGVWIFFRTVGNIDLFTSLHLNLVGTLSKFCLILLGIYIIIFSRKTVSVWGIILIYLPVLIATFITSKSIDFFFTIFIVLVSSHLDIDTIYKGFLRGILIGIIFVLLLFVLGILPDIIQVRLGSVRHSFGFSLPLIPPALFFSTVCAFLYLYRKSYTWKSLVIIFIIQIPIYLYCDGRGPFILTFGVLLGAMIIRYFHKDSIDSILFILGIVSLLLVLLFSIYIARYYNGSNTKWYTLNQILTGRPQWWNLYWNMYTPKLFGQELIRIGGAAVLENSSVNMMILDNGYLSILLEYGIIALSLFLFLIIFGLINLWKRRDTMGLLIFIVWIFYGLVSNQIYFIDRNVGLILIANFISFRTSWQGEYIYG